MAAAAARNEETISSFLKARKEKRTFRYSLTRQDLICSKCLAVWIFEYLQRGVFARGPALLSYSAVYNRYLSWSFFSALSTTFIFALRITYANWRTLIHYILGLVHGTGNKTVDMLQKGGIYLGTAVQHSDHSHRIQSQVSNSGHVCYYIFRARRSH